MRLLYEAGYVLLRLGRMTSGERNTGATRKHGIAKVLFLLIPGQLISWGTLYYAITFLAAPIGLDTGWRQQDIFMAFSAGLLVTALAAVPVGRLLVRHGGRKVLCAGSVTASLSLVVIAYSHNLLIFTAGWLIAGMAMSMTQYEAAFSALRSIVPHGFRQAIGWLTIVGGLASTAFWPLTHWLTATLGWRQAVLIFAALHIVPGLLLHAALPSVKEAAQSVVRPLQHVGRSRQVPILLALTFGAIAIVTATISTQAGQIIQSMHVSQGFALLILAIVGPMQVAGRILDLTWGKDISASKAGLVAMATLIVGLILLAYAQYQPLALFGFAVAYGMANGVFTLVRGRVPAELMPSHDYAVGLSIISWPALFVRAAAPVTAAWLIALWGAHIMPIVLILVVGFAYMALHSATIRSNDHSCCQASAMPSSSGKII